jgi:23S rRNA (guanine1835-N2)-methyltransferase
LMNQAPFIAPLKNGRASLPVNTDKHCTVDTPFGSFDLRRYPIRPREQLRAWNGADLLLLEYAREQAVSADKILVVNDDFGALGIPLMGCSIWTDSQLAMEAIGRNNQRLGRAPASIIPASEKPGVDFELVLLRIPKQLSLLRYQLAILQQQLKPGTVVACAGMDKHLPRAIAASIEAIIGSTQRHRGQRKARLFSTHLEKTPQPAPVGMRQIECAGLAHSIEVFPNVFSGEQLDPGSRLLLEQFAQLPAAEHIVDLCCGCGVLGLVAMAQFPAARLHFLDESDLAIANARHNVQRLHPQRLCTTSFLRADGLRGYDAPAPGLILCNPPFHQQYVSDDYIGRRLLKQAARILAPGGQLWLVANRHLPYASTLRGSFSKVEKQAGDSRYIVWRAQK